MKSVLQPITSRVLLYGGVWLYLVSLCTAQPTTAPFLVSVKHLTVEQGLPDRTVLNFGQDSKGFVWVTTLNGAYRFDGQLFDPLPAFTAPSKQPTFNTRIEQIATDPNGHLWIGNQIIDKEAKTLSPKNGQLRPPSLNNTQRPSFGRDAVTEVAKSASSRFRYVFTRNGGVWRYSGNGAFSYLAQHKPEPHGRFTSFETATGTLCFSLPAPSPAQSSVLLEYDSTGRKLQEKWFPFWLSPVANSDRNGLYLHRMANYFGDQKPPRISATGLDDFLYHLTPGGQLTPVPIRFNKSPFPTLTPETFVKLRATYDRHHQLFWITAPHVLFAWYPQQGIVFDLSATDFPPGNAFDFRNVFIDRAGAVWVASNNGFLLLTLEPNRFRRYMHTSNPFSTAERYAIRGMTQVGNRLWVNAVESRWLDLQTGEHQPVLASTAPSHPKLLNVYPILAGAKGLIWGGGNDLMAFDPQTGNITGYALSMGNYCRALWQNDQQNLLIGRERGLIWLDSGQGRPRPFTGYTRFPELQQQQINGFFPDPHLGGVWIATSSGLYWMTKQGNITARYSYRDNVPAAGKRLPPEPILFVHPDSQYPDIYWLATRGGGLIRWNRRRGTYEQFTTKQGLSDNTIYAIYEDRFNRLWLPSNYGLMSFNRKTHQIQIYHTKDGIADEEFNSLASYRAPDGRLFLGGLNGITAFYPDQIQDNRHTAAPLLVATYQKLDTETGQMVNHLAKYHEQKEVHLASADRLFKLSFALLDYRYLGQIRLWYRIGNWQEKWVMQEGNDLLINGLPAGAYTLEVRAQTINGDWASSIISVPILVDKPFYFRGWFLLLCFLLLGGLVTAIFRWRNKQLIADKIRLEAEVARRTAQIEQQTTELQANATLKARFFANVTHEFRTPLTLLLGPIQYLSQRITDSSARQLLGAMERNAHQLLTLVSDLLDLSRMDAHQLNLSEQPGDISQLVQQLLNGFLPQAQYLGIHLHVSGTDKPCPMYVDAQKLETVLRNLIANALHHTASGGHLRVTLSCTSKTAILSVSDTGSGIHPDDLPHIFERYFQSRQPDKPLHGGTGIGLSLCQEYCHLWGGELTVSSELGKGSTFTVSYPIRKAEAETHQQPAKSADMAATPAALFTPLPALPLADTGNTVQKPAIALTILLVDDNPDMLLYTQTLLAPYYNLQVAHTGREALHWLSKLPQEALPNLIISDIMMPEVDGLALVRELRTQENWRHIPIVLLTARTDLASRLQALQFGIADYLTKPFYEAELLTRVQNLLHRVDEQASWQLETSEAVDAVTDSEADWIQWLQQTIHQNLTNKLFTIKTLADMAHLSERQLNRRTKALTGLSPSQLIQEIRLQVAYDLFEKQPDALLKTVAYRVGYQKPSYFSQLYRERFGIDPEAPIHNQRDDIEAVKDEIS